VRRCWRAGQNRPLMASEISEIRLTREEYRRRRDSQQVRAWTIPRTSLYAFSWIFVRSLGHWSDSSEVLKKSRTGFSCSPVSSRTLLQKPQPKLNAVLILNPEDSFIGATRVIGRDKGRRRPAAALPHRRPKSEVKRRNIEVGTYTNECKNWTASPAIRKNLPKSRLPMRTLPNYWLRRVRKIADRGGGPMARWFDRKTSQLNWRDGRRHDLAGQDELLKLCRLTAARQRVHHPQAHPDQGSRFRVKDLDLIDEQLNEWRDEIT